MNPPDTHCMPGKSDFLQYLNPSRLQLAWSGSLADHLCDEQVAASIRARQLNAVLRLAPLTMLANAANVLLIVAVFWPVSDHRFLLVWAGAVGVVVVRGMRLWWRVRRTGARRNASPRALRRATWHSAILATLWAVLPVVLFPGADGAHQLLVAVIVTGMMCAGGFALATTPAAGTVFVLILGMGAATAVFRESFSLAWHISCLLFLYALIVVSSVWSTARMFGARLLAEAEAERQNEVIGLLLRDFEENASDVLWEVDANLHLCRISPRLAGLFSTSVAQLSAAPIIELLEALAPKGSDASQLQTLHRHLRSGTPFRDLALAFTQEGRTRWWSLTAKPLRDSDGRCTGWRGVAADITDARRANRRLTWLAHYDPLTGLVNRHQFRSELTELIEPEQGSPQTCAVLCLDLDHFKAINDTLGHAIGDGLLKEVALRLLNNVRNSDTVARLGGDEFAIILRGLPSSEEVGERTARLLAGLQTPCDVQGTRIAVRASIGVALAPRDGDNIDALLNNADVALYAAKSAGRGEYRIFEPQMAALTRRRLIIEQALRDALSRGELSLVYQPQINLADHRVTGFEALLRWHHPELGEVSPVEFISIAEDTGLIHDIGEWVLEQACQEATRWPADLTVSVNVSPVQALSHDLLRVAKTALDKSGLAPGRLEIEITESIFMNETETSMAVLSALRNAGMRIALDDFGTGYSSLAYLRRIPFDTLKIDRSFVRELMSRRDARAIAKMIIGLAQTLNLKTIAEGVEEPDQAEVLSRYGCDMLQGYLVSRPMPAAQLSAFLAKWRDRSYENESDVESTEMLPLTELG